MVERGEAWRGAGGDVDRGLGVGGKVVLVKGKPEKLLTPN